MELRIFWQILICEALVLKFGKLGLLISYFLPFREIINQFDVLINIYQCYNKISTVLAKKKKKKIVYCNDKQIRRYKDSPDL